MSRLELKIPPVAVTLLVAGLMGLAARYAPQLAFPLPARTLVAGALALAGLLVALAGVWAFRQARTTVDPTNPGKASALVSGGIYRWTRNPMYVGMLLGLAGWAAYLANGAALAGLPLFVAYLTRFQIIAEERALVQHFGESFIAYCARVRRWL